MRRKEIVIWVLVLLTANVTSLLVEDYSTIDSSDIISLVQLTLLAVLILRIALSN